MGAGRKSAPASEEFRIPSREISFSILLFITRRKGSERFLFPGCHPSGDHSLPWRPSRPIRILPSVRCPGQPAGLLLSPTPLSLPWRTPPPEMTSLHPSLSQFKCQLLVSTPIALRVWTAPSSPSERSWKGPVLWRMADSRSSLEAPSPLRTPSRWPPGGWRMLRTISVG